MSGRLELAFFLVRLLIGQVCLVALLVAVNQMFMGADVLQPGWERTVGRRRADPARAWHELCVGMTRLYRVMAAGAVAAGTALWVRQPTLAFMSLFTGAPANYWLQRQWRQATRDAARGLAL